MLYEIFTRLYVLAVWLAAFVHPKAKKWLAGRRDWRKNYPLKFQKKGPVLWLHAASLGEFEQGRPVLEAFRAEFPGWQIVLTFWSPSGFEIRKNFPHADFVCYLPADSRSNARDFLDLVRPDAAVFVKYEFWKNYLAELKKRAVPTFLVSAVFRENQPFFKFWGGFWRGMLGCFSHVFVQDTQSFKLLQSIGFQPFENPNGGFLDSGKPRGIAKPKISVAGDTRIDRVLALAENAPENPVVEAFLKAGPSPAPPPVFIAGSAWAEDEAVFVPVLQSPDFQHFKIIVAPHEPREKNVFRLVFLLGKFCYSKFESGYFEQTPAPRSLIIDNVGLLNTLYRYGSVAFIGGGFGRGIHNILEPAAYGLPVVFGPNYRKFEEAKQLLARGGAFCVEDAAELAAVLKKLADPVFYQKTSEAARGWLLENRGASERIMSILRQIAATNA